MSLAAELAERCAFPPPGAPIDCAVSGGRDSLALLVLAAQAGCRVTAYHVDHQLRPGSGAEADVVAAAARRFGCAFVARRVDVGPGPNLESRARAARLGALPTDVATGHTADDQAETVLLNLCRGAGLDGLAGMRFGPRHPILHLRRSETHRLVDELGLAVVEDPSNGDPNFVRNRVRAELLPLLAEIARRDVVPLLARQAELIADEVDFLDAAADAVDPGDLASINAAPLVLRRRAVRRFVRRLADPPYPPSAAAVERVLQVAAGALAATEVSGGLRLRHRRGRLVAEVVAGGRDASVVR